MKIETPLLASFASTALAANVHQLNFTRSLRPISSNDTFSEGNLRSSFFQSPLKNQQVLYSIDIQVGTPPQTISVDLDTGSSDLFVNGAKNTGCDQDCQALGTFDSSKSSTYSYINDGFSIGYGDGTGATGNWVKDKVAIGDVSVPLTFADATDSSTGQGIFGIGYASLGGDGLNSDDYINYPKALVKAGIINSQTYSMYLNSLQADSGVVLFGGVDQTKYTGTLGTVPLTSSSRTTVTLNSLKLSDGSFSGDGVDILLDTGTTLTYLPGNYVDNIATALGATTVNDTYIVTCDTSSRTFDFTFGCVTVRVPVSDFQSPLSGQSGRNQLCSLDLIPTDSILGDSFLRSAYIVFDLDNQQASIAQASLNKFGVSNIKSIPAGRNSVPGATVCNA